MYCRYCGKSISDDSVFCTHCGKPLFTESVKPQTPQHTISATPLKIKSNALPKNSSLFINTFAYVALGVFLLFNIEMAPFYGGWKFIAYIAEAAFGIALVTLTKRKIAGCACIPIKVLSLILSIFIIFSSVTLRVIYDNKVDSAQKDIPKLGTILVDINCDTDYYSYMSSVVYDPSTSVIIDGSNNIAKIEFGIPFYLEIVCRGNHEKVETGTTLTLYPHDFENGEYSITKTVYIEDGLLATIKVALKRVCTFWDVIFY